MPQLTSRDYVIGTIGIVVYIGMIVIGAGMITLGSAYSSRPTEFYVTASVMLIVYGAWSIVAGLFGIFASAFTTPPTNEAKTLLDFLVCLANMPYYCCTKIRPSTFYLMLAILSGLNVLNVLLCSTFGIILFIYATVVYTNYFFIMAIIGVLFAGVRFPPSITKHRFLS